MAGFTGNYTFKNNACCELYTSSITFWERYGLPDYEDSLDGFAELYPAYMQELVTRGIVKRIK